MLHIGQHTSSCKRTNKTSAYWSLHDALGHILQPIGFYTKH